MVDGPHDGFAEWKRGVLSRVLAALLVVVAVAVAVAGFFVVRTTVADQEHRILQERAGEAGLILQSAFATVSSQLAMLGVAARLGDSSGVAFGREARATTMTAQAETVALVRRSGGRLVVVAADGRGLKPGDAVSGARAAVATGALTSPKLTGTPVFRRGSQMLLGFALGPPAAPPNEVIYLELPIDPTVVTRSGPQSPFHELDLALYASAQPDSTQVVLKTIERLPLRGRVVSVPVSIGQKQWLLAASARQPLVGSFAEMAPWILFGVGLFSALLVGAGALVLLRRRDYALAMVDERTEELENSLRELRETQERLVLQQRLAAIGQVAAAVGHELRNPLGVMTNALYLIRSKLSAPEEERVHKQLDTTEREIAAATGIVESLLGFARDREPVTELVDFSELLDESLSVAPPPAGVEIARAGLDAFPPLRADPQQLRQVLLNLLTNGYEAMDGKGVLTVSVRVSGDDVEIRFSDTGAGLDEETASQIFEPFFTKKAKGIGLGLAVTKQIVQAHGGRIVVESRPAAGATFVLTLPNVPALAEVG